MRSVPDIIEAFGGPTKFGRACGFTVNPGQRGFDMKSRGAIPIGYWNRLVGEAKRLKVRGITYASLAEAHEERMAPPPVATPSEAEARQ